VRLVISGLTAAGKTTLARKLADQFALEYFSASTILRQTLGDTSGHWTPALDLRRNDLSLERRVDQLVQQTFRQSEHAVFDCWGLPWIAGNVAGPAVFVWIESDLESRLRKCFVSYVERDDPKSYGECRDMVIAKDAKSREIFMSNWGFDIYTDQSPFNIVLDASSLIPRADLETAKQGARTLHQAFLYGLRKVNGASAVPELSASIDSGELIGALIVKLRGTRQH
jgi:cytidylate kinase